MEKQTKLQATPVLAGLTAAPTRVATSASAGMGGRKEAPGT